MDNNGVTPEECRFLEIVHKGRLTTYNMFFESVSAVELFLRDEPDVNKKIFLSQVSKSAPERFAGAPLDEAIRYCVGGYEENYDLFLELSRQLESVNRANVSIRTVEPSFVGHRPNIPAYIADAPKTMYRNRRVAEKKAINVFMQAVYDKDTTEKQILHRGILALNLISLLERNGYIVNFRLFEASVVYNEIFICEVVLKKQSEKLDPRKCYYPMCGKAFVRRVLFRIKESMPFRENWHTSYGIPIKDKIVMTLLNIGEKDIYIGTPRELDIEGKDMYSDADAFLLKLGLDENITIPKYVENE